MTYKHIMDESTYLHISITYPKPDHPHYTVDIHTIRDGKWAASDLFRVDTLPVETLQKFIKEVESKTPDMVP